MNRRDADDDDDIQEPLARARASRERFALRAPILLASMTGACPPSLSLALARAGALGECGALMFSPEELHRWVDAVRAETDGPFQVSVWVPDPPPVRDAARGTRVRELLSRFGPPVPADAGDARLTPAWANALAATPPEGTTLTRASSGPRRGRRRSIAGVGRPSRRARDDRACRRPRRAALERRALAPPRSRLSCRARPARTGDLERTVSLARSGAHLA